MFNMAYYLSAREKESKQIGQNRQQIYYVKNKKRDY